MELGRSLGASFQGFERLPGGKVSGSTGSYGKAPFLTRNLVMISDYLYLFIVIWWDLIVILQDNHGKAPFLTDKASILCINCPFSIASLNFPFRLIIQKTESGKICTFKEVPKNLTKPPVHPRLCFEWRRAFHLLPLGFRYCSWMSCIAYTALVRYMGSLLHHICI